MTAAYDFALPADLVAQSPAPQRDASRLMVVDGERVEDRIFVELPALLMPGDLLVLNETRVIAARLVGTRARSGGRVELLLLQPAAGRRYDPHATRWRALARPARRLLRGERISFDELGDATIVGTLADGIREVEFDLRVPFEHFLELRGTLPLPPYIHNVSRAAQERYQTVFASVPGSIAAPTASLHFTPEVFEQLERRGVEIARLVLDVGLGTFRPIASDGIDEHAMHGEAYNIPAESAARIESAHREGRRIVAAGTTVVRALEGNIQAHGRIVSGEGTTVCSSGPGSHSASSTL